MDQLKKTHCRSPGTVGTYSLSGRPHRPRYRHPRQRRSLRTVSNGHTTEYPEWLTCFRPVIPILSDRQATRRRPPNEPAKNRQMKLTVTLLGGQELAPGFAEFSCRGYVTVEGLA